jgi:phage protein D
MPSASPSGILVPQFEISVDNTVLTLEDACRIVSVVVDLDVKLPGLFEIEFAGVEAGHGDFPMIDDEKLFAIGKETRIKIGYANHAEVIDGEITALEPLFSTERMPALVVRGLDRRHRLQRGRHTRTFLKQKDSDIASKIASEAGLAIKATATSVSHEYMIQANQSDMDFLLMRAQRIGYELLIDGKQLVFGPVGSAAAAALTLTLGDELLEFRPTLSAAAQVTAAEVSGWGPKDKAEIVGKAAKADVSATGTGQTGPALVGKAFGDAADTTTDWPVATQAEADLSVKARMAAKALATLTVEGRCLGDPALIAGSVVTINGVGKRFGGDYYVTTVRHQLSDRGYYTSFCARRNSQ